MTLLKTPATLPRLRPSPCCIPGGAAEHPCQEADGGQVAVLYTALLLGCARLGTHTGGIQPCVVAFRVDQLDMAEDSGRGGTSTGTTS